MKINVKEKKKDINVKNGEAKQLFPIEELTVIICLEGEIQEGLTG